MSAVRVRRKLDSEILHLPELKPLIGKTVEIVVREQLPQANHQPGPDECHPESETEPFDCFDKLAAPEPLDAAAKDVLQRLLSQEQFEALMDIANRGGPDLDIIGKIRAATRP